MSTAGSDTDYLGVWVASTLDLTSLHPPQPSIVTTDPDCTLHEAGKFCKLALKCNPSLLELLYLPEYERATQAGMALCDIRSAFLSAKAVRNAYFGYATQQFSRIKSRGDGSFSADTRNRTAKHARHLLRLLDQGLELYQTGTLTVKVAPHMRDAYFDFGEAVAGGNLNLAESTLAHSEATLNKARSPLPDKPDDAKVSSWLRDLRKIYMGV